MTSSRFFIGVDIGTTNTKAVLFTQSGEMVEKTSVSYSLQMPTPTAAEQDPEEIVLAVINSVENLVSSSDIHPTKLVGISFSSAMHSFMAVDAIGAPLSPLFIWADNRSIKWSDWIYKQQVASEIYQRTGTPIHPMSPLVKLIWLRQEKPEIFNQAAKFISIKEYLFYRLFNRYIVDYSIAASSGLLNLATLHWDGLALDIAEIQEQHLSQVVPKTYILESMQPEYRDKMGLPKSIITIIGSSDGVLSNLGVGAILPGEVAATVGTSGAIRTVIKHPQFDAQQRLFCYPLLEKYWILGGATNNGGIALHWVRDRLGECEGITARNTGQKVEEILVAIAQTVAPGSEGLIFHPYLAGERAPMWNPNARGSFFGLGLHHSKAHLVRAVLEGIFYNLYLVFKPVKAAIGEVNSMRVTGGFMQSDFLRQLCADIFGCEIFFPKVEESSCLGAAILGLYALEEISSLEVASEIVGEMETRQAIASQIEVYQKILPLYEHLLEIFQTEYSSIMHLQAELPH